MEIKKITKYISQQLVDIFQENSNFADQVNLDALILEKARETNKLIDDISQNVENLSLSKQDTINNIKGIATKIESLTEEIKVLDSQLQLNLERKNNFPELIHEHALKIHELVLVEKEKYRIVIENTSNNNISGLILELITSVISLPIMRLPIINKGQIKELIITLPTLTMFESGICSLRLKDNEKDWLDYSLVPLIIEDISTDDNGTCYITIRNNLFFGFTCNLGYHTGDQVSNIQTLELTSEPVQNVIAQDYAGVYYIIWKGSRYLSHSFWRN